MVAGTGKEPAGAEPGGLAGGGVRVERHHHDLSHLFTAKMMIGSPCGLKIIRKLKQKNYKKCVG